MDWDKVIATMKQIGNNKFNEANRLDALSGYHEGVKANRLIGEVLMCLAASLSAGRQS